MENNDITNSNLLHDPSSVQMEQYSGPLDLLLQLIKEKEMDIFNINICEITHQYLTYLDTIPQPDLEQAGDFIRMAALLIYIKSETLLPKENNDEEETSDLKKDLTALLVTYQKFQEVGSQMYKRSLLGRDIWPSGAQWNLKLPEDDSIEINSDEAPFLLIKNYGTILRKRKKEIPHKIQPSFPSLLNRVKEIMGEFILGAHLQFSDLSKIHNKKHSAFLTFLSILELAKLGFVSLFQSSNFSEIDIKVQKEIDDSAFKLLDHEEQNWMSQKLKEEFR